MNQLELNYSSSFEEESSEPELEPAPQPVTKSQALSPSARSIEEFQFDLPIKVACVGPTGTGKSTTIRWLIKTLHQQHPNKIVGTWWFGENFIAEKWLPKGQGDSRINYRKIDKLREVMGTIHAPRSLAGRGYHAIVVLDDIGGEQTSTGKAKKWIDKFISNCRHSNISVIVGVQYTKFANPSMRANMKQWIVTHINDEGIDQLVPYRVQLNKQQFKRQLSGKISRGYVKMVDFEPTADKEVELLRVPGPLETL